MSVPVGALASKSRAITASSVSRSPMTEKSSSGRKFDGNTRRPWRLTTKGFMRRSFPAVRKDARTMLERVDRGEVVDIDGGMGTELEARGAPMDHEAWCGIANLEHPNLVREIHEDYIRAGADVIITNTYPTSRPPLERAGYGDRVVEANRA